MKTRDIGPRRREWIVCALGTQARAERPQNKQDVYSIMHTELKQQVHRDSVSRKRWEVKSLG